jgi:hypothetical protein
MEENQRLLEEKVKREADAKFIKIKQALISQKKYI